MAKTSLRLIASFDNPFFSSAELSALTQCPDTDTPHIYVVCQESYKQGCLHGRWIDATQEPEAITNEIAALLSTSLVPKARLWLIECFSGFIRTRIEQREPIAKISRIAQFIAEHGDFGSELLALHDNDVEAAEKTLEDCQNGQSDTHIESLAEHFRDQALESLPKFLRLHIQQDVLEDNWLDEELGSLAFG